MVVHEADEIIKSSFVTVTNSELELVAVNDLASTENLAYLLEFDTTYGRLKHDVKV